MDEVSSGVLPSGSNTTPSTVVSGGADDLWRGAEDDATGPSASLTFDASEGGLFNGNFVPPPPRPLFLDESIAPDGLTTCDLCSWALRNGNSFAVDTIETPGEVGWVLTLVIVSLISAIIGAIVMIIVLHCKRIKNTNLTDTSRSRVRTHTNPGIRPPISTPEDKSISTISSSNFPNAQALAQSNSGVWSWLSRRSSTGPSQLDNLPCAPAENHYTHMEDSYHTVGEALYAELDRDSTADRDSSNSPAYQNSAYTDPEAQVSSAPSSAYYSDLSVTTFPDRTYEIVGLATLPNWDGSGNSDHRRHSNRLAAISESVPSDYV